MQIMTDSPIRFPGLFGDWAFTGSSVAFHIGGKAIYWYGIIIALGVLLALWFCMKQKEKYGITEDNLMDGVLWGIPLAIVGARLYYVLFYLDRFKKADGSFDWAESIAIWDGGLAIYGGVIAAVLVCFVLSKKRGFKLGALTDLIVMGFLIGQAVGRWGNFMNREAFGAETTLPWRMQLTTVTGQLVEVHPTFLYESLWNVIGLLLIVFVVSKARRFDGENTCFYFLWYGVGRFWIEGLRTDSLYLGTMRVSQLVAVLSVIGGIILLFVFKNYAEHLPKTLAAQTEENELILEDGEAPEESDADADVEETDAAAAEDSEEPAEEAEETAAPPQDISAEGDTADNENTEDEDKKE